MENNPNQEKNKPLVSIIMPVYNSFAKHRCHGEPFLNQAIESVLAQGYKNFELLIVDSRSSDNTSVVCQSYALKDKRIRYIFDSKKLRAEEAMEIAASIMRGKYCVQIGDDDIWHKDYILKSVSFLEDHPEISMAYSNADFIDFHNKTTDYSIVSEKDVYRSEGAAINNFCAYVHKRNVLPMVFGVFRAEVFKKVFVFGPFDDLRANLDNLFIMRFFLSGFKCHFINERLFFYRNRNRKLSDAPLISGMPGLNTPILIWLYYVRHQLFFLRKIKDVAGKEGKLFELVNPVRNGEDSDPISSFKLGGGLYSFSPQGAGPFNGVNIFLNCVIRDSFISHSIKLLHWIRADYVSDEKNKDIYKNLVKFIDQKSIVKGMQTDFSSGENDLRYHPIILKKRVQDNLQRMNSFFSLLNYCVVLLFPEENQEIVFDLKNIMENEIDLCAEEERKVDNLQEKIPIVNLKKIMKQRVYPQNKPKVSVITASYNLGRFLRDTMNSVTNQSYDDFEHIVIDGASTDDTLQILKEYPHIKLISEKDDGPFYVFRKGLDLARGDYIIQCRVSDGYIDEHWIEKCVEVLDRDKEVSLVWGLPQYMTEDSKLGDISYPQFHNVLPPQKNEFIYYWLSANFVLPEGNFCVRRRVLEELKELCFLKYKGEKVIDMDEWFKFNYYFNAFGYLPYFVPTIANFGRIHGGHMGEKAMENGLTQIWMKKYLKKIKRYRTKLILKIMTHKYRDGEGRVLPYEFSGSKFIKKYMFLPDSIAVGWKVSLAVYLSYVNRRLPKIYNIGRKIYHKIKD